MTGDWGDTKPLVSPLSPAFMDKISEIGSKSSVQETVINSELYSSFKGGKAGMPGKRWTEQEIEFLRENHGKLTYPEIAKALRRGEHAVEDKAWRLGLKQKKHPSCLVEPRRAWTEEDDDYLRENWQSMRYGDIGSTLGRTAQAVSARIRNLSLEPREQSLNVQRPVPPKPTMATPGSITKRMVMERRVEQGFQPNHPEDVRNIAEPGERGEPVEDRFVLHLERA